MWRPERAGTTHQQEQPPLELSEPTTATAPEGARTTAVGEAAKPREGHVCERPTVPRRSAAERRVVSPIAGLSELVLASRIRQPIDLRVLTPTQPTNARVILLEWPSPSTNYDRCVSI